MPPNSRKALAVAASVTLRRLALRQLHTPAEKLAYTVDGAAFAYGISERTIRGNITHHRLLAKRVGTRILIDRDELRRWFEGLGDALTEPARHEA